MTSNPGMSRLSLMHCFTLRAYNLNTALFLKRKTEIAICSQMIVDDLRLLKKLIKTFAE